MSIQNQPIRGDGPSPGESPAPNPGPALDVEQAVAARYSAASQQVEPTLCCPVQYDAQYLEVLPPEILERDYGCGNPARDVQRGETVLDLGSGGGKICFIASQIVGPEGRVWGVDMNDEMLALARRFQPDVAARIGWDNVRFFKGRIQDLALDLDAWDRVLAERPVQSAAQWLDCQREASRLRSELPMIPDNSVDVVISNCVLNLVRPSDRRQLFREIFRVLKRGGRAVISDIVSDEPAPEHLRANAQLWSGCISGAFVEDELFSAFEEAGFYGLEIVARQAEPWAVVEDIEFRSATVRAFKGKEGPCRDFRQAVIYRGPWREVQDDDGHVLQRGQRMAVCQKTYEIYTNPHGPYAGQFEAVPPRALPSVAEAPAFDCHNSPRRSPRETKRGEGLPQLLPDTCCGPDCC